MLRRGRALERGADAEAYGIGSTASDLIRFVELNLRPDRLDAEIRQAIEGTHVGHFRIGAMTQGLGWEQYAYPVASRGRTGTGVNRCTRTSTLPGMVCPERQTAVRA